MGNRLSWANMSMRPVRQQHGTSCGIACVAMITGRSYSRVMKEARKIFDWPAQQRSFYTTSAQLRELLLFFKTESKRGRVARNWSSLPARAIVGINHHEESNSWHWVVYRRDADQESVLDPRSKHIYRCDFGRMRLKSCIPIN